MRIQNLVLEKFRGVKSLSLDMNGADVDIYGANGTGKTTVANAILWLLTDTPATGEKGFSPKTVGTHNLHHIARMTVLDDNGAKVTLEKDYHEVWKRKRGAHTAELTGHEVTCTVNGVPMSKTKYMDEVEELAGGDEERIKALCLPDWFAESVSMEERRRLLFEMCGNVNADEVMEKNGLKDLRVYLQEMPIDFARKALDTARKRLNKELDTYPARIEELKAQLAKDDDTDLEAELAKAEQARKAILSAGQGSKLEAMREEVAKVKADIEAGRLKHMEAAQKANAAAYEKLNALTQQRHKLEEDRYKASTEVQRTEATIQELTAMREGLVTEFKVAAKEYKAVHARQWDSQSETCPTCGQALPANQIANLRADFAAQKDADLKQWAERKAEINQQGQACSAQAIAQLNAKLHEAKEIVENLGASIAVVEAQIKEAEGHIAMPTAYEDTTECQAMKAKLAKLTEAFDATQTEEQANDTSELDAKIAAIHERMALRKANEKAEARIAELEVQRKDTATKLDDAERGIHLCDEFQRAKARMVTDRINKQFQTVQWLLFREQVNGGLKEVCEPMIPNADGTLVEYRSANTAAKANAGLEIIEALAAHWKVHMPILIDRAEGICHPMPTKAQTIRLIVSANDASLRMETVEKAKKENAA